MKENIDDGQVKFCFAETNGNLEIKFYGNRNMTFNTFELFLAVLDRKLRNSENDKGKVFLKGVEGGGGWHFFYLIFNFSRFIIFTFRNYSLQNCVIHLQKNYLFLPP